MSGPPSARATGGYLFAGLRLVGIGRALTKTSRTMICGLALPATLRISAFSLPITSLASGETPTLTALKMLAKAQ